MTRPLPPCCAEVAEPPCPQHHQAARIQRQGPRSRHGRPHPVMGDSGKAKPAAAEEEPR